MFERFTDRARQVVTLAQDEARRLNHSYIGTEHILLGLVSDDGGVAARALTALGISLGAVRQQTEEIIGQGQQAVSRHIPFTPRARRVLELALREALQLGHDYIGTEHILLALVREGDGVAAQVLVKLGASLALVRETVTGLLRDYSPAQLAAEDGRIYDVECRGGLPGKSEWSPLNFSARAFLFPKSAGRLLTEDEAPLLRDIAVKAGYEARIVKVTREVVEDPVADRQVTDD